MTNPTLRAANTRKAAIETARPLSAPDSFCPHGPIQRPTRWFFPRRRRDAAALFRSRQPPSRGPLAPAALQLPAVRWTGSSRFSRMNALFSRDTADTPPSPAEATTCCHLTPARPVRSAGALEIGAGGAKRARQPPTVWPVSGIQTRPSMEAWLAGIAAANREIGHVDDAGDGKGCHPCLASMPPGVLPQAKASG